MGMMRGFGGNGKRRQSVIVEESAALSNLPDTSITTSESQSYQPSPLTPATSTATTNNTTPEHGLPLAVDPDIVDVNDLERRLAEAKMRAWLADDSEEGDQDDSTHTLATDTITTLEEDQELIGEFRAELGRALCRRGFKEGDPAIPKAALCMHNLLMRGKSTSEKTPLSVLLEPLVHALCLGTGQTKAALARLAQLGENFLTPGPQLEAFVGPPRLVKALTAVASLRTDIISIAVRTLSTFKSTSKLAHMLSIARAVGEGADRSHGQLIVLGYKEFVVQGCTWKPLGAINDRFILRHRELGNNWAPAHIQPSTQFINFITDPTADLFQLGRMDCPENDWVVRGPIHVSARGRVCGPVSRHALRIVAERSPKEGGTVCRLYAAGFSSPGAITLPEGAPQWRCDKDNATIDGLTTFGIRFYKPSIGEWREVSILGQIRVPRTDNLATAGKPCPKEDNILTTGTIIDIGGVQLLYESPESMLSAAMTQTTVIREFAKLRPQCPVQLHTIRFDGWKRVKHEALEDRSKPRSEEKCEEHSSGSGEKNAPTPAPALQSPTYARESPHAHADVHEQPMVEMEIERAPFVFPACGHVHGYAPELRHGCCPMCRKTGPFVELGFSWVPAIDSDIPEVVFNPCGHMASTTAAERWSKIQLPNNAPPDAVYRAACPCCAKPLSRKIGENPFNKIIFQTGVR